MTRLLNECAGSSGEGWASQVKRAVMGPVGMFVGTTQMSFDVNITDNTGQFKITEQLKTTIRGESESKNVADNVARTIAKRYALDTKKFEKSVASADRYGL